MAGASLRGWCIEADTVFAVKKSPVVDFDEVDHQALAEKWNVGKVPFRHTDFDNMMRPIAASG
jgi:hypothetical protein